MINLLIYAIEPQFIVKSQAEFHGYNASEAIIEVRRSLNSTFHSIMYVCIDTCMCGFAFRLDQGVVNIRLGMRTF